ncbi:hypothetical protein [Anaerophilus nitritogenes]|uniref:hypothetical protein n=1 Tax=Anaerophilus nitritogenes TaxID=2498136 RepID=UPI00101DDCFB|nr:hypothetical protein [Anaerophilus nitritogenes]
MDYLQEFREKCKDVQDYIRLMKEDIHFKDSIDSIESFVNGIIQEVEEILMDEELNDFNKIDKLGTIANRLKEIENKYFEDGSFKNLFIWAGKLNEVLKRIIQEGAFKEKTNNSFDNIRVLYHGTSIESAKNVLATGVIKTNCSKPMWGYKNYNRIFLTASLDYAKLYSKFKFGAGAVSAEDRETFDPTDRGIIFEINTIHSNVYTTIPFKEYIIFDHINADDIITIFLREGDRIIKVLTKEELMQLKEV